MLPSRFGGSWLSGTLDHVLLADMHLLQHHLACEPKSNEELLPQHHRLGFHGQLALLDS